MNYIGACINISPKTNTRTRKQSICKEHRYVDPEWEYCPKCGKKIEVITETIINKEYPAHHLYSDTFYAIIIDGDLYIYPRQEHQKDLGELKDTHSIALAAPDNLIQRSLVKAQQQWRKLINTLNNQGFQTTIVWRTIFSG